MYCTIETSATVHERDGMKGARSHNALDLCLLRVTFQIQTGAYLEIVLFLFIRLLKLSVNIFISDLSSTLHVQFGPFECFRSKSL